MRTHAHQTLCNPALATARGRTAWRARRGAQFGTQFGALAALTLLVAATTALPVRAEKPGDAWGTGVEIKKTDPAPARPSNTTVIERAGDAKGGPSLRLVALLTVDGQQIDQGLVWRIFQAGDGQSKSRLIGEHREASPALKLQPGEYLVNAAFGRANLTRKVVVKPDQPTTEQFVLNAGGLRLNAVIAGKPVPSGAASYAIYADERDQFNARTAVMTGAKPNLIIRLNAGIYHIVSTYGDANAKVETDVTVEAGKLTETTVAHAGGKASFKLVARAGGEALPDVHWSVQTEGGEVVKENVGALPTHILAPGKYVVTASSGGRLFKRNFEVKDADSTSVEVVMADTAVPTNGQDITPSLDFKNP